MESKESRTIEQISRCAGDKLLTALHNPKTIEIMLNPDGSLWVERLGQNSVRIGELSQAMALALMQHTAGYYSKELRKGQHNAVLFIDSASFFKILQKS